MSPRIYAADPGSLRHELMARERADRWLVCCQSAYADGHRFDCRAVTEGRGDGPLLPTRQAT